MIQLVENEEIIYETKPILLSFFPFYFPSIALITISIVFIAINPAINNEILTKVPIATRESLYYLVQWLFYLVPAIAYSIFRLNMRWFIVTILSLCLGFFAKSDKFIQSLFIHFLPGLPMKYIDVIVVIFFGMVSLLQIEAYRNSHNYIVTNARILTSAGVFRRRERILFLSKINDISIDEGIMGSLFGYANIVPITASGVGMGSNFASVQGRASLKLFGLPTIGVALDGGHSIQVPKYRTHEVLFGVREKDRVVNEISSILARRELNNT
jgi:membrane protein YdbS with pleckstrin-like domain